MNKNKNITKHKRNIEKHDRLTKTKTKRLSNRIYKKHD